MQLPEYLTPEMRKPDYFTFNRSKGQDQMLQPSEFQTGVHCLVSTDCTTLKMGAGPGQLPSINLPSKRIKRDHSRRNKLWLISHARHIRHLARAARP